MSKSKERDDTSVTYGSGNVFADLGLPNPEQLLLKARLASMIYDVIEARGWTQTHAAEVMGIKQPDVSDITRGRLTNFSAERLIHLLGKLDQRVTITVRDEKEEVPPKEIVIDCRNDGRRSAGSQKLTSSLKRFILKL